MFFWILLTTLFIETGSTRLDKVSTFPTGPAVVFIDGPAPERIPQPKGPRPRR